MTTRRSTKSATYPTARVYTAVLTLRRRGERVENYCRDRRLHVIGNAILDEATLIARAGGVIGDPRGHSRRNNPSTNVSAITPELKLARAPSRS